MLKLEKNIHVIFLFLLGCRLAFIFSNAVKSPSLPETIIQPQIEEPVQTPSLRGTKQSASQQISSEIIWIDRLTSSLQNKVDLTQDIGILETEYQKNKNIKVGTTLIEKLAQNYEFEKANQYLQELIINPDYDGDVKPTLHLYIAIHDPTIVSITDPQSIQKIIPIMDEYKNLAPGKDPGAGRLEADDYNFYQGLIKLRYKDYKWARELFNGISSARYKVSIQAITQAISTYNSSKAIPKYYQDALVSLALLKNGYFSIAKKLALETALEDNKYILPYQILAYTHFLTNNRESANDYFLKLADVDISNKNLYKFLIGISFYRSKEYSQAILYLSQVNDASLQTDAYRYMLLSYKAEDDIKSMVDIRQKLLGQQDLPAGEGMTGSDYYDYFYQAFYAPYSINVKSAIYEENKLLADMYLTNCTTTFTWTAADICTYGNIGRKLIDYNPSTWRPDGLSTFDLWLLTNLANTYNESYLFSIIGDLYRLQNNLTEAKKSYAQALSLSTDSAEQDIIKSKISQINN